MATDSNKQLRIILSENIKRIRKALGYSQEELADRCGLHRTYIGSVERAERNVSVDNIGKIAAALNVKPATLLSEECD